MTDGDAGAEARIRRPCSQAGNSSTKSLEGMHYRLRRIESVACVMTVLTDTIHPTINYKTPDPMRPGLRSNTVESHVKACPHQQLRLGARNCDVFRKFRD
jgi:3-oxoacyl-(acyl-carrier-protein) synthase